MSTIYRDSCDHSRTLKPVQDVGTNSVKCRVYFDGKYAGTTVVPKSLLLEKPKTDRDVRQAHYYGFVAARHED